MTNKILQEGYMKKACDNTPFVYFSFRVSLSLCLSGCLSLTLCLSLPLTFSLSLYLSLPPPPSPLPTLFDFTCCIALFKVLNSTSPLCSVPTAVEEDTGLTVSHYQHQPQLALRSRPLTTIQIKPLLWWWIGQRRVTIHQHLSLSQPASITRINQENLRSPRRVHQVARGLDFPRQRRFVSITQAEFKYHLIMFVFLYKWYCFMLIKCEYRWGCWLTTMHIFIYSRKRSLRAHQVPLIDQLNITQEILLWNLHSVDYMQKESTRNQQGVI